MTMHMPTTMDMYMTACAIVNLNANTSMNMYLWTYVSTSMKIDMHWCMDLKWRLNGFEYKDVNYHEHAPSMYVGIVPDMCMYLQIGMPSNMFMKLSMHLFVNYWKDASVDVHKNMHMTMYWNSSQT